MFKDKPYRMNLQLFAADGAAGGDPAAADPNPAPVDDPVATDPAPEAPDLSAMNAEMEKLRKQVEASVKAQKAAEGALDATKKELSALKRSSKSAEQLLEEDRQKAAEELKTYRLLSSGAKAKQALAGMGLAEDDYLPLSELITGEDGEKTESIAKEIAAVVKVAVDAARKAEREAVLKESPELVTGGKNKEQLDPFIEAFRKG